MTEKKNKTVPAVSNEAKRSGLFRQYNTQSRSARSIEDIVAEVEGTSSDPSSKTKRVVSGAKKNETNKKKSPKTNGSGMTTQVKASHAKTGKPASAKKKPIPSGGKKSAPAEKITVEPVLPKKNKSAGNQKKKTGKKGKLKIISLGGLGEVGKNITIFETETDMIIADCGSAFPDDDLPGVDLVIPDFTYILNNREKVRGIFITHGHEDHIGALPYLLKELKAPVYGTALTIGLIKTKLEEHGLLDSVHLSVTKAGDTISVGSMSVEFVRVNHSIPDACAFAIRSPAGLIILTGDFKVDYTPISGKPIDLARFGELGSEGVLAVLSDSTNAEKPGKTPSERIVGDTFNKLFLEAEGKRIIIATFASNVHRVQQVINTAVLYGRKVCVFGRSMVNVINIAKELGYLSVPDGTLIEIENLKEYTDDQIVLITTGSQGEPMSALTRMATGAHKFVHIGSNDYIIISATPIPGNENSVGNVVNDLMKLGADVIYERMYDVHVSGHACQDETRLILSLTKPKYFMPMHGEYKHLVKNASVATGIGFDKEHIIISDIGKVVECTDGIMKLNGTVPNGRILVDGLGVGDVGAIVLRDRKMLSDEGLIVVAAAIDGITGELLAGPDLISRGFVYVRENEDLMAEATDVAKKSIAKCDFRGFKDWNALRAHIRDDLGSFIFSRTKRRPVILPVIQEID